MFLDIIVYGESYLSFVRDDNHELLMYLRVTCAMGRRSSFRLRLFVTCADDTPWTASTWFFFKKKEKKKKRKKEKKKKRKKEKEKKKDSFDGSCEATVTLACIYSRQVKS